MGRGANMSQLEKKLYIFTSTKKKFDKIATATTTTTSKQVNKKKGRAKT